MHPAYTEEKARADQLARDGLSVLSISRELGEEFPSLAMYERDTIARVAFEHAPDYGEISEDQSPEDIARAVEQASEDARNV
jgi:hypothetical protein